MIYAYHVHAAAYNLNGNHIQYVVGQAHAHGTLMCSCAHVTICKLKSDFGYFSCCRWGSVPKSIVLFLHIGYLRQRRRRKRRRRNRCWGLERCVHNLGSLKKNFDVGIPVSIGTNSHVKYAWCEEREKGEREGRESKILVKNELHDKWWSFGRQHFYRSLSIQLCIFRPVEVYMCLR